jgi:hypothetical protein
MRKQAWKTVHCQKFMNSVKIDEFFTGMWNKISYKVTVLSEKQKQDVLEKPKMYLCEKKVSGKLFECTYFR